MQSYKSYIGPYVKKDGDTTFEYVALKQPAEPNKILAILTKEVAMEVIRAAMTETVPDESGSRNVRVRSPSPTPSMPDDA